MNYPFWEVPFIGSGWVIGMIAIFHVMISQFAVGGGLWLPIAERKALREGRQDWMNQVKRHARFFLILTGVFGTVSGVGIWFAIGLTHPEATSTLIHNFVFGWAIEWVFFLVELTTIAVYYYTWDRIPEKLHLKVGWVYAVSSVCTLVIINGILTFMLTPGNTWLNVAGTGHEASKFWNAFFNPTYWPSLLMRTLVCITLAGVWALITGSLIDGDKQAAFKASYLRWTTRWLVPSFVLMPLSLIWFLHMVPESQRALLSLGVSTIGAGTFSQVTRLVLIMVITSATIVIITYYLAYKNPQDFTLAHASAILMLALMATGAGEMSREMLRKPYVIGRHMYSNGTRVSEVTSRNQNGYLQHTLWLNQRTSLHFAQGEAMYRGQCGSCHTLTGYRSLNKLLAGRDRESISSVLTMLHEYKPETTYRKFMPPLTGTQEEVDALRDYLYLQANPATPQHPAPATLKAQK
ncbi:MAG: cytochrome ubiquinol oxidase subunit I [Acidobacteriaceae bacterium]|jgi:cytochrome bd-type quinol oxidase subunit 1|nr:cytochrome ubiquinol oxidase subunit I [Acidobacteriaceae bacterium]